MPVFPTPRYQGRDPVITSDFGPRDSGFHIGVDILYPALPGDPQGHPYTTHSGRWHHPAGIPALAVLPGVVTLARMESNGGHVVIQHDDDFFTGYRHLRPQIVEVGDRVRAGTPVGVIGKGKAGVIHLHFDAIRDGVFVDPAPIIEAWPVVENPWTQPASRNLVKPIAIGLTALAVGLGGYYLAMQRTYPSGGSA
jgi:murein DD-endopeptidase MepM/ murein hydrolase activator NlpD